MAGFTRSSSSVAAGIAISSLVIVVTSSRLALKWVIVAVTVPALILTTAKSITVGYLVAVAYLALPNLLAMQLRAPLLVALGGVGVALPALGWFLNTQKLPVIHGVDFLYTLAARLAETWPDIWTMLAEHGHWFFGRGVGGLGVSQRVFESIIWVPPDNLYLFVYGTFGLLGLLATAWLVPYAIVWRFETDTVQRTLSAIAIVVLVSAITDKVLQSGYLGFAGGLVLAAMTSRLRIVRETPNRHGQAPRSESARPAERLTPNVV